MTPGPRPRTREDEEAAEITAALRRAAREARRLSIETGTPFWVLVDGEIVDLNAAPGPRSRGGMPSARRRRSP